MINLAGTGNNEQAMKEMEEAGIEVYAYSDSLANSNECRVKVIGTIGPWFFTRSRDYWVAKGPGLNIEQAIQLNEKHGKEVRADGYIGGIDDLYEHFKGFAVTTYHIDSQEGLNVFTELLKKIMKNAKTKEKQKCLGNAN